jgi:hypothetical protein
MAEDRDRNGSRFDEAFRRWAQRPPSTAPEVAATRVVARLGRRTGVALRWRLALAGALLLGIPLALWLIPRNGEALPPAMPAPAATVMSSLPLDDNVVLSWLDPETPVYFVMSPPDSQ